jgi:hypothetical protein
MVSRRLPAIVLAAVSLGLSGCALLLVGAGVAGGYAISKDSVRNLFDLPKAHVYEQSLAVAKELGAVTLEDRVHGRINAQVQDINVTITVRPLTQRTVELKVKARNDLLMPKVDTAQEVYSKIIERL